MVTMWREETKIQDIVLSKYCGDILSWGNLELMTEEDRCLYFQIKHWQGLIIIILCSKQQ